MWPGILCPPLLGKTLRLSPVITAAVLVITILCIRNQICHLLCSSALVLHLYSTIGLNHSPRPSHVVITSSPSLFYSLLSSISPTHRRHEFTTETVGRVRLPLLPPGPCPANAHTVQPPVAPVLYRRPDGNHIRVCGLVTAMARKTTAAAAPPVPVRHRARTHAAAATLRTAG